MSISTRTWGYAGNTTLLGAAVADVTGMYLLCVLAIYGHIQENHNPLHMHPPEHHAEMKQKTSTSLPVGEGIHLDPEVPFAHNTFPMDGKSKKSKCR